MKKIFLVFIFTLLFLSSSMASKKAWADDAIPVPAKSGSDITFINGGSRIGGYTLLTELPGFNKSIDGNVANGGAGEYTLAEYIKVIVRIAIGVIGVLAVVMIVVAGVQYMGSGMVTEKEAAKQRLTGAVFGLILAVSSVLLLRTINPQLTNLSIGDERFKAGVDATADMIGIPAELAIEYLDTLPNTTISGSDTTEETFLGYLAHQQGAGGASAILWAAKNQYKTVPADNPYAKGYNFETATVKNWNNASAQKNIGTSERTVETFIKYWSLQVKKARNDNSPIEPSFVDIFKRVSQEEGISEKTLITFCRIESYGNCKKKEGVTHTNSSGYVGLFQFGDPAWKDYGKGNRKDAYDNTKAAARLHKANMATLKKNGF